MDLVALSLGLCPSLPGMVLPPAVLPCTTTITMDMPTLGRDPLTAVMERSQPSPRAIRATLGTQDTLDTVTRDSRGGHRPITDLYRRSVLAPCVMDLLRKVYHNMLIPHNSNPSTIQDCTLQPTDLTTNTCAM